jgi:hypothetical protein
MDNEKTEGTETLEKNTGDQPLDLDQLIKVAVDGTESDSASSSDGDAEGKTEAEQTKVEPEAPESESAEASEKEAEASKDEPAWFERRLGKEVRRKKEALEANGELEQERDGLKEEIEQLKSELTAAQQQPTDPANPLSKIDSLDELETERKLSLSRLDFVEGVEELLDEGDIDAALKKLEQQEVNVSSDREEYGWEETAEKDARRFLKKVRSHARRALDVFIPEQGQHLTQKKQFNQAAKEYYPDLLNQDSEFAKVYSEVRSGPAGDFFNAMPDGAMQLCRWVKGFMAETAEAGKKPSKARSAKVPPSAMPRPSSAPVKDGDKEANYRMSRDQVMERGDGEALDAFIGNLLSKESS